MPPALKTFLRRIANWLIAVRSVTRTAREAERLGGAVTSLNERILFLHEEFQRLSALYEGVSTRMAMLEQLPAKKAETD